jgi:hypothetical protein
MAEHRMTRAGLLRAGGLALLAGSIAFVTHVILRSVATSGADPVTVATAAFWIPLNVLGLLGALLVLVGLPAILPALVDSGGRASLLGLVLLAASWTFFGLFLSLYGLLVLPWLAERAPSLVAPGAPLPPAFIATFVVAPFPIWPSICSPIWARSYCSQPPATSATASGPALRDERKARYTRPSRTASIQPRPKRVSGSR